jgi:hypothetical protein
MRITPTAAIALMLLSPLAGAAAPRPATRPTTTQATTRVASAAAPAKPENPLSKITQKDIDSITYDDIEDDAGFITPLAADLDNLDDDSRKRLDDWVAKLDDWKGAQDENVGQRVRNLLDVCCLADMIHSEFEGETAYMIFDKLKSETDKDQLIKACAWIILKPDEGKCVTKIPELGWDDEVMGEDEIRARAAMYAKKLLGRLVGKLPKKE